ncbi:MAG: hypothetical protein JNM56_19620 [Planctomycetia bacterium]|nr:hypothetical protein [Planctomycetia bacterium]
MHRSGRTPTRGCLTFLLLTVAAVPVVGQPAAPGGTVALPTDRKAQQVLHQCRDWIEAKNWEAAASALHALLDQREDGFAQVEDLVNGQPRSRLVSVKAEVSRVLEALPAEGKQVYLKLHGADATQRLQQARQLEDPDLLADVAARYLHTPSGPEALLLLGNRSLSRDDPVMAALYFERRLRLPGADTIAPLNLYRMALAFYRAGDKPAGDRLWQRLATAVKPDGGLKVGKEFHNLDQLRKLFDRAFADEQPGMPHWPIFRGGPRRTESAAGGIPILNAAWSATMLPNDAAVKAWTENHLNVVARIIQGQRGEPLLPAFFPVVTRGQLFFRGYDGVQAVETKQRGKLSWHSFADGGLHTLQHDPIKKGQLDQWETQYRQNGPHGALFENSLLGVLATDGERLMTVDDLPLMPHPVMIRNFLFAGVANFGGLSDQVNASSLKGYNCDSGKLIWELGGRFDRQSGLDRGHFLGAPLPLGGRYYLLHEKNLELRLVCLEPRDAANAPAPPDVMWMQTLALAKDRFAFDYLRRTNAALLAHSEGILVCPTNAGTVLGFDLLTRSVAWAYAYRAEAPAPVNPPPRPFVGMMPVVPEAEWRVAAPAIHGRKLVFTAPDANALHCIDLRDGSLHWKLNRGPDDLYFAGVFAGKAVIVGKNHCKAIDIEKGVEAWRLDKIGMPSGQGTASGNLYFLPLASGPDQEPEISVIDVVQGKVTARVKSKQKEVPGNLIFAEDVLYSQTLKGVAAYPLVKAKE